MTIDEKINALEADIVTLQNVQREIAFVDERNNEASAGASMLDAIAVLLREAVMHYEEEIATLKGPGAA